MVNKRTIKASDKRMLKGIEMKEKILHSVLEIVGTSGIQKLSASTISEKVGISKANIFHHFRNMQEIRIEACLYFLTIIKPPSYDLDFDDPKEYLVELQKGIAVFLNENKVLNNGYSVLYSNEAMINPDFSSYINDKVQGNKKGVKEKLRKMLDLDENNRKSEDILFCLDIIREGVNIYVSETPFKDETLKAWAMIVDIMLEKIREIH